MSVHLEVKYSDNISDSLTVLSDDRFSEFLTLIRERVSSHIAQQSDVKHTMNLYEFKKLYVTDDVVVTEIVQSFNELYQRLSNHSAWFNELLVTCRLR